MDKIERLQSLLERDIISINKFYYQKWRIVQEELNAQIQKHRQCIERCYEVMPVSEVWKYKLEEARQELAKAEIQRL